MTSSKANIFRDTGSLCGEFTGRRWIPHTKVSNAELWCFLWSAHWINGWINNHKAHMTTQLYQNVWQSHANIIQVTVPQEVGWLTTAALPGCLHLGPIQWCSFGINLIRYQSLFRTQNTGFIFLDNFHFYITKLSVPFLNDVSGVDAYLWHHVLNGP